MCVLAWLPAAGRPGVQADATTGVEASTGATGPAERPAGPTDPEPVDEAGDGAATRPGPDRPPGRARRAPVREPEVSGQGEWADDAILVGIASTYGPGWDGWIAWPGGPGWRLRICGVGGCVTVITTDAGPDLAMQRAGRLVDLDVARFERVAGVPWTTGLTRVKVTVLGRMGQRAS